MCVCDGGGGVGNSIPSPLTLKWTPKMSIQIKVKRINSCLCTVSFIKDKIVKILKNLDPNKDHCHHMTSIYMLRIQGELILKLLKVISKLSLESKKFLIEKNKANIVPFHKKMTNN